MDRTASRRPPTGRPLVKQTWGNLLFLHWPIRVARLRELVPAPLEIDTYEGMAWIGVTPFAVWDVHPEALAPAPILGDTCEINVRTYVRLGRSPGVWFLSLDASNPLAVLAGRRGAALPYYQAAMSLGGRGRSVQFSSRRVHPGAMPARFEASWTLGAGLPRARPGTLEFFLIERYCLYARRGGGLLRARLYHKPWPLRQARVTRLESTMLAAQGLPEPTARPLVHAQAAPFEVGVWAPQRVGTE